MTRQTFYRRLDALKGKMCIDGLNRIRSVDLFRQFNPSLVTTNPLIAENARCCPIEMLIDKPKPYNFDSVAKGLGLSDEDKLLIINAADSHEKDLTYAGGKQSTAVRTRRTMLRRLGLSERS